MKNLKTCLPAAVFCCLATFCCASVIAAGPKPDWFEKTIMDKGEFIYSVGHSKQCATEDEAKQDALASATETFVKYCRVDIQSFDRSIELYSKFNNKSKTLADVSSRRIVRANAFVTRAVPEEWHISKNGKYTEASVLLKVPKEEFDRISKENNIRISLDILFYCEDAKGKMLPMEENSVLSTGGGYAIYVNPSDPCYIYVYQTDSSGASFRLFPNAGYRTGLNPIEPAAGAWLPNDKQLYQLDETTGKEFIFVFASREPIPEFEKEGALKLTKTNLDSVIELKKMGVAGIKDKRDAGEVATKRLVPVMEVKKKLQAEGNFVYETWFWHK